MDINKYQLFFFGCWNNGGCKNNGFLRKIVDSIITNNNLYDGGIILGDNVYPTKLSNFHDISVLKDGIECINRIKKPMYIALGNHDVTQCDIITHEAKNHDYWIFDKNYFSKTFNKNNLSIKLIVIDTNLIYDNKIYQSIHLDEKQNIRCDLPKSIDPKLENMMEFIKKELSDSKKYNWIIIAGHHPIAFFKQQKDIAKPIINAKFGELVEIFGSLKNLVYICADTHNFQYNIISNNDKSKNVKQFISGTGGALPDMIVSEFKDGNFYEIGNDYKILLKDTYSPYGYCDMIITENNLVVIYNNIVPMFEQHLFMIDKN